MKLFDRSPGIDASTYAEAQALLDDGLDRQLVLDLYPDDVEWLGPLLRTSQSVRELLEAEAPSFYFEATLKAKFLAAAASQQSAIPATVPVVSSAPARFGSLRAAAAGAVVLAAAGLVSFVTLGFVTADRSVPGEWNYVFKRSNERLDSTLSSGQSKIDVQLNHADARVAEIRRQAQKNAVKEEDLQNLQGELDRLAQAVAVTPPSPAQKEKLNDIRGASVEVLSDVGQRQAALAPAARSALESVNVVAAAAGLPDATTVPIVNPTATASATPSASPTAPASPSASPTETTPAASTPTAPPATPSPATPSPTATPTTRPAGTPTQESDTSEPAR